ncbi:MAG: hypothetical protein ACREIH_03270 [Nitrospiraceae bacterium]
MSDPATPMIYLLEVTSLRADVSAEQIQAQLDLQSLPIRVLGRLERHPALVLEASCGAIQLSQMMSTEIPLEVTELRRRFVADRLEMDLLRGLIAESRGSQRLAIGLAAAERAMQRRRLELLIIASNVTQEYHQMLRAIIESNRYEESLIISDLTRDELGRAAGVRRAGCVGLLRSGRCITSQYRQVNYRGRAVSSLPGSSSSAS